MVITRPSDFEWLADLCRRESPSIIAFCRRHLDNEQDAFDACQETFLRAVLNLDKVQASARPGGWLMTTAKFVCSEARRRAQRTIRGVEKYSHQERRRLADADERSRQLREIAELVEELTPGQRDVIRKTLEGSEPTEIAEEFGLSQSAVNTQIHRARQHLLELMESGRAQEGNDA